MRWGGEGGKVWAHWAHGPEWAAVTAASDPQCRAARLTT
jgi:hypothetical protein